LTVARLGKYDARRIAVIRNKPNPKSMKIIIFFFATLFLAAMTFAQQESPSPAAESTAPATEEKASATVEEAAPAAKPEESTVPAVKSEPAASPKAAATAAPAKAATTNAAKPATSAPASSTAKAAKPAANKNMAPRDAENAWEAAVMKHDSATIDGFLAADFQGVSSKNKFVGRSEVLSELKGDKDTYKSAKNDRLNVKMYGNNVAVVTGRARETGAGKDGKKFDRTYLFTDTWMMRGGKWQCIASQITKIKG
jgi:ketosteroid isomerase-like protein